MESKTADYEIVENNNNEVTFELSVKTLPEVIDNRKEFFKSLDLTLEQFKGITLTDETVKDGKKTVANLRKAKDLIDTKKRSVKKEILKPYEEIEAFCKEANSRIDSVIEPITIQLNAFEEARIEKKQSDIDEFLNAELESLGKKNVAKFIAECEWFKNPQWINSTYAMSKIKSEVQSSIGKILNDLDVLAETLVDSTFKLIALETYKRTGDVSQTIQAYSKLAEQAEKTRQAIEEQKAQRTVTQEQKEEEESVPCPAEPKESAENTAEGKKLYRLEVELSKPLFDSLIAFLKQNGIHGRIIGISE